MKSARYAGPLAVSLLVLAGVFADVCRADGPLPELAPVNPQFTEFMAARAPARLLAIPAGEERGLGYLPGPVDYSYLQGQQIAAAQPQGFQPLRAYAPQQYDLRPLNRLTPMRNQGSCGDCWAFAAMGAVESFLMPGESRDFSENNLKNTHGFDWGHCDGGNGDMSTAYFTRWGGPVNEADDPHNPGSSVSPAGLALQKQLREVIIIPPRAGSLDNDALKQAIMDYGGVQTSFYVDSGALSYSTSAYFRPAANAYYYTGASLSNHAIVLVGWDDTFDRNNFSTVPPGNGAFIVRNSWGANWGDGGYFYISYYDTVLGKNNYQFRTIDAPTGYARLYQHDPLGKTGSVGYGTTTAWFANVFTAAGQEALTAAGFHAASAGSAYELYVYTNVTTGPTTGTLAASSSGIIEAPGYHPVSFSPVPLTAGQKFSLVVKLTTPGYNYPIPMERPVVNYSSAATAAAGQSYVSGSGSGWSDLTGIYANTNVCLKGYSQYPVTASVSGGNGSIGSATPVYVGSDGTASFTLVPDAGYLPATGVTGSCPAGSFSGTTYTTGAVTAACTVGFSFVPESSPLTITFAGSGSGTVGVAPSPPAMDCTGTCSQTFGAGTPVTLTPAPAGGSVFSGWVGCPSLAGSQCSAVMDGARSLVAYFNLAIGTNVKVGSTFYGTISGGHAAVPAAGDLYLKAGDFYEILTFNRPVPFTMKGGRSDLFDAVVGVSTVHGAVHVSDGTLSAENIVVMP